MSVDPKIWLAGPPSDSLELLEYYRTEYYSLLQEPLEPPHVFVDV